MSDENQDWQLVRGRLDNEHTILEFKRHLTTCDEKDMDITVSRKVGCIAFDLLGCLKM